MPTHRSAKTMAFAPVEGRAVVADFNGGAITSHARALLLGTTDRAIGQLDLFADRTSAATMRANQFRLWFASTAYVLLTDLRRIALAHTELANATCGTIRALGVDNARPVYSRCQQR